MSAAVVWVVLVGVFGVLGQTGGQSFTGAIGGSNIEMEVSHAGDTLTGSYWYRKSGSAKRLGLRGRVAADGSFAMQETDAGGKVTGEFKGKWNDDKNAAGAVLEGEWFKPGQTSDGLGFYAFEQMVYFTSGKITTREFKEKIKAKKADLSAEYPELAGTPNAAGFNMVAKAAAMRSLAGFRKDLAGFTAADIKQLGEMGNYIDVGYDVMYADDDLISVSFGEDTFTGGAHPNHGYFTITYDLKAGRQLKLADLFKPGAKYLSVISAYAIRDLKGRKNQDSGENLGYAQDIFADGAKATLANYSVWNVTKKGLLITFPQYQVASYADGPQSVMIPYSALKSIALAGGALGKVSR